MASIHKRNGVYYVYWRESGGRQLKKSLGASNKAEAARRFVEWENERVSPATNVDCAPELFWKRFAPLREKSVALA